MTDRQLKELRQRMVDKITELYRNAHRDVNEVRTRNQFMQDEPLRDEADESQRVQFEDLQFSRSESEARLAQSIEAALGRIDKGDYGECIDCGNEIDWDRLRAVPWSPRCIDCQEAVEAENRERATTL